MWDSIKEYMSTPEFADFIDRAFEVLGSEPIAPVLDFLFYWMVMGPMMVVDYVVLPITNVIGGVAFVSIIGGLVGVWLYQGMRSKNSDDPTEEIPHEEVLSLVEEKIKPAHPRYGRN